MRIGMIGAPCTGKTTLAKAVSQELNIHFIGESFEGALKVCRQSKWYISKFDKELWPEYFERVWKESAYSEIINFGRAIGIDLFEQEVQHDSFITDSASPNLAAAALLYNVHIQSDVNLTSIYDIYIGHTLLYDYLFYLPILPMVDDCRRPTNLSLQLAFDLMLVGITGKNVYCIEKEWTLHQRVEYVLSVVKK